LAHVFLARNPQSRRSFAKIVPSKSIGQGLQGRNYMLRSAFVVAAIVAALVPGSGAAEPRQVQVGQLTCSVSASVGLIVGSQKNVNCIFRGQPGEPEEAYMGTMSRLGLDVGFTTGGVIVWTVFADTDRHAGMLAGTYGGATAEATLAAGLGANVLVGGSHRSVALQPLSLQGQTGLNVGAGIGELELHPAQ
jgi:hypothetical protein